jgi:hypothetical protein
MSADLAPIEEGDAFALLGNEAGTEFLLRCKSEGMVARLAGEDGARFKADYDEIKTRSAEWRADQTLAQLWDQGGYSWLAQTEGGGDGEAGAD